MIAPIDQTRPSSFCTATFGLGCFWGPDAMFGAHPAILRTRVGYAGGTTSNPSYRAISDYIEAVQIDFDPEKISFEALLRIFWDKHEPLQPPWKRQYQYTIFYHDDQQHMAANNMKAAAEKMLNADIFTEILAAKPFYLAEDYHQKYRLQQMPQLNTELRQHYPNMSDFINSTAVARVNGILGGFGNSDLLEQELASYGLSKQAEQWCWDLLQS